MNGYKNIYSKIKTPTSFILVILVILYFSLQTEAIEVNDLGMIKGYATAYNGPTDTTCTGKKVREGICGGCKAYIGKTIILYQRLPDNSVGKIIGIYECEDTGTGTQSFQEGKVIDVWQPNDEAIQEFANLTYEDGCKGHVWIQVIEANG